MKLLTPITAAIISLASAGQVYNHSPAQLYQNIDYQQLGQGSYDQQYDAYQGHQGHHANQGHQARAINGLQAVQAHAVQEVHQPIQAPVIYGLHKIRGHQEHQPIQVQVIHRQHPTHGHQAAEAQVIQGYHAAHQASRAYGIQEQSLQEHETYQGDEAYRGQIPSGQKIARVLSHQVESDPHNYQYVYETENGIKAQEVGSTEGKGTQARGAYSYTGDDGQVYTVTYTADENGFRPIGAHLPTPPPMPEAIAKAVEQNAKDQANGVYDDGKYVHQEQPAQQYQHQQYENGHQQYGHQQSGYQQTDYQQAGHQQIGYQQTGHQQTGYQQAGHQQPGYQLNGYQHVGYLRAPAPVNDHSYH